MTIINEAPLLPVNPKEVTLENWQQPPFNRWSFQNLQTLITTANISRGSQPVQPLASAPRNLMDIRFVGSDQQSLSIREMLSQTYTNGFLVMHRGKIVSENYFNGMRPDSPHLLMSCTKSYVGTLAGVFVGNGSLDVSRQVTDYVPALKCTGIEGATVRQVLDMSAGIAYSEAYDDPLSDIRRAEIAMGWHPGPSGYEGPDSQTSFTLSLKDTQFPHGEKFCYRSVLTNILAMVLEAISGKRLQELFHEVFWSQLGCEWNAAITVDSEQSACAEGGLNACLRDWARFGQMMLQNGYYNGKQIIPEFWVNDCCQGDQTARDAFAKSDYTSLFPKGMYRNQWWNFNTDSGAYAALGIHGQSLYIYPRTNIIIAKMSTHPTAEDHHLFQTQFLGMEAIANELA